MAQQPSIIICSYVLYTQWILSLAFQELDQQASERGVPLACVVTYISRSVCMVPVLSTGHKASARTSLVKPRAAKHALSGLHWTYGTCFERVASVLEHAKLGVIGQTVRQGVSCPSPGITYSGSGLALGVLRKSVVRRHKLLDFDGRAAIMLHTLTHTTPVCMAAAQVDGWTTSFENRTWIRSQDFWKDAGAITPWIVVALRVACSSLWRYPAHVLTTRGLNMIPVRL